MTSVTGPGFTTFQEIGQYNSFEDFDFCYKLYSVLTPFSVIQSSERGAEFTD